MASLVRMQVQLTAEQAGALRVRARAEERSLSDLVRESVTEYLARRPERDRRALLDRARELTGLFHSGCRDVAENHDQHLDEAYGS
ncbi:MAG: ribbon-helix-helix protein, CopG family [Gammaproteobacteria bacterium]|nr:ribbon-helix-helix protein, CopG family [Gammaproteobacteria bacterium]